MAYSKEGIALRVVAQKYTFTPEDIELISSELRMLLEAGEFLTLGRHGERLEQEFARYHGLPWAVATNSGTGALEIILRTLCVVGKEVIVPSNTFAATAFAVIRAGGRPVFADILPDLTLDPSDAAARITANTAAVITVHIGGLISSATLQLAALCRSRNIPLIEDAAHAHGSNLDGRAAGSFGLAAAFSFFSTKVMTTGEGGMIVTGDESLYRQAQVLRDQAKVRGGNYHETVGYNWRMPEIQAIMGLTQLRRLDEFIARRQLIAAIYDSALAGVPGLQLMPVPALTRHNYYKYVVFLRGIAPDEISARLKQNHQVPLSGFVYELPLHEQPAFRSYYQGPLTVAEDLCRRHICLPIYPNLSDEEAQYVAAALRDEMVAAGSMSV
jgi:dTDP-4-amino-4,6-dideoxygalactose transaminase